MLAVAWQLLIIVQLCVAQLAFGVWYPCRSAVGCSATADSVLVLAALVQCICWVLSALVLHATAECDA